MQSSPRSRTPPPHCAKREVSERSGALGAFSVFFYLHGGGSACVVVAGRARFLMPLQKRLGTGDVPGGGVLRHECPAAARRLTAAQDLLKRLNVQ